MTEYDFDTHTGGLGPPEKKLVTRQAESLHCIVFGFSSKSFLFPFFLARANEIVFPLIDR